MPSSLTAEIISLSEMCHLFIIFYVFLDYHGGALAT